MKPEDVIKQLVGVHGGWDDLDTMIFQFYKCGKFNHHDCCINFQQGTLEVYSEDGSVVEKTFAIKATLEEL